MDQQKQKDQAGPSSKEELLEEEVPLTGEIQAVDTYFTEENELAQPDYELGSRNSETMDLAGGAPEPQRRIYEGAQEESPYGLGLEDSRNEFAAELSPVPILNHNMVRPAGEDVREQRTSFNREAVEAPERQEGEEASKASRSSLPGWIAIILAISSMFYMPAILGPAAAIAGVLAFLAGNRALGIWSVVLGLISLFAFMFLIPFYS